MYAKIFEYVCEVTGMYNAGWSRGLEDLFSSLGSMANFLFDLKQVFLFF
jgi:hypothetical protein